MLPGLAKEVADFSSLERFGRIRSRHGTTLVDRGIGKLSVFKGIDFRTFLHTYENGVIQSEVEVFKRAAELVAGFGKSVCVQQPPQTLVTVTKPGTVYPVVYGVLFPDWEHGSVDRFIDNANLAGVRIPIRTEVKWCYQMTLALLYTHHVANTYHMNVTPANFVIDSSKDPTLVDWEQDYAAPYTAAPEVDGTWNAAVTSIYSPSTPTPLQYTKHRGPSRRNMINTHHRGNKQWMEWNPFKQWHWNCPRACELAEVFSLGRSMWMLLRQVSELDLVDVDSPLELQIDWQSCDNIPSGIKRMVESCMAKDPNERPNLQRPQVFWKLMAKDVGGVARRPEKKGQRSMDTTSQ